MHRQIRALVILDGLIQNAGPRFQRAFADEPLLERLRVCGTSDLSDPDVKKKCRELFRQWSAYSGTPGLSKIAALHKVGEAWPGIPRPSKLTRAGTAQEEDRRHPGEVQGHSRDGREPIWGR